MPVGEPISGNVIDQIKAREELFSSTFRDDDKLKYLSSRNAWVRVISFVNKGGSPDLSENFVLSSVASAHTGSAENPGFSQYSGVNFNVGSNSNSFYSTTEDFGTRPRPGITSFNIKSKNSGGTIQLAEIGFVVWNEDDLDTIEQLYLRLGFEVMVEWGHTLYIDNDGNLEEYVDQDYKPFFEDTVEEITVKDHIRLNRNRTDNNVDGFLGYITNFSWSFRQDGGYECSIKVISAGAVIESLLGKLPSSDKSEFLISDCYVSDFHSLYKLTKALTIKVPFLRSSSYTGVGVRQLENSNEERKVESINFSDQVNVETVATSPVPAANGSIITYNATKKFRIKDLESGKNLLKELQSEFGGFFNENRDPAIGIALPVNTPGFLEKGVNEDPVAYNIDPVFLPLRYCLALINSIIKRQKGNSSILFDLHSEEKFLTSENLIVVKPLNVLLLVRPDQSNFVKKDLYYKDAYEEAKNVKFRETALVEDEILNIFVNLEVFVRNITSLIENNKDENTINLFTLLTNVLEEISESVSNGIDLGIIYDEETSKFKIIDNSRLPGKNDPSPGIIQISGISTTVSSLTLTSKVTNKLGNQISIAAQTKPSSYPASVIKYREWNDDLTSRLKRIETGASYNDTGTVTYEQRYNYFGKLNTQYEELNGPNKIYYSDEWESLSTYGQIVTREGIDYDPDIPKGLIPIELSFTMDGIAGLKNLQSFKIPNKLLPKKYDNRYVGFIIQGLEHTVENNRWYTQVRAQMYLIRGTTFVRDALPEPVRRIPIPDYLKLFDEAAPDNTRVAINLDSIKYPK